MKNPSWFYLIINTFGEEIPIRLRQLRRMMVLLSLTYLMQMLEKIYIKLAISFTVEILCVYYFLIFKLYIF